MVLNGGDVAFQPDSDGFVDPSAAMAVVKPIADKMLQSDSRATLTGTTANVGDKPGQVELSRRRAQAVANLLVQLGVPAARLTVEGLGSDFEEYAADHDAAGNLIPDKAAQNRKVIIQPSGSGAAIQC